MSRCAFKVGLKLTASFTHFNFSFEKEKAQLISLRKNRLSLFTNVRQKNDFNNRVLIFCFTIKKINLFKHKRESQKFYTSNNIFKK
jgi:ribosomal protein S3AE